MVKRLMRCIINFSGTKNSTIPFILIRTGTMVIITSYNIKYNNQGFYSTADC